MGLMSPNLTELLPAPWYPHHGCLNLGFTQRSTTDISVLDREINTAIILLQIRQTGWKKAITTRITSKKIQQKQNTKHERNQDGFWGGTAGGSKESETDELQKPLSNALHTQTSTGFALWFVVFKIKQCGTPIYIYTQKQSKQHTPIWSSPASDRSKGKWGL